MNASQLALPLKAATSGAAEYLLSESNRDAAMLIGAWPEWPSPVLVLEGPPLSGKSLLVGAWAARAAALMIDAKDLRAPVTVAGNAAVDGLESLADEAALFHLYEQVLAAGGSLLIAGRLAPAKMPLRLNDLGTRLRAAPHAVIGPPEDELLERLLLHLAGERQLALEPALAGFALARMERSHRAVINLIEALDRRSLAAGRAITRELVSQTLAELGGA